MGRVLASQISGYLQKKMAAESEQVFQRFLGEYQRRLAKDLDRIALGKLADAGLPGPLTFTVTLLADRRTLAVTPSDAALFKRLEFGEFDDAGNLRTPPHSVLSEIRATLRF
jgi:hypothetical protein